MLYPVLENSLGGLLNRGCRIFPTQGRQQLTDKGAKFLGVIKITGNRPVTRGLKALKYRISRHRLAERGKAGNLALVAVGAKTDDFGSITVGQTHGKTATLIQIHPAETIAVQALEVLAVKVVS